MTATAPRASEPALPPMTHSPDPAPAAREASADTGRPARAGLWAQITENPLLTLFGGIIIAVLSFNLTTTNLRINDVNDRIDRVEDRIERVEVRIDRLEAKMDARFEALEHSVAEIDRKLTALIAALNKTAEVDAAMAGDVSSIEAPQPAGQAPDP